MCVCVCERERERERGEKEEWRVKKKINKYIKHSIGCRNVSKISVIVIEISFYFN